MVASAWQWCVHDGLVDLMSVSGAMMRPSHRVSDGAERIQGEEREECEKD